MTSLNTQFLCPCEEQEATIKNPTTDILFCPFCGIKIEESLTELELEPSEMDENYDNLLDDWDSQDRDRF
jgi:hypothetical protein